MRRREFITVIGGAAATWPTWPIAAQQSTRPVVALINGGAADALVRQAAAFRKGLGETGYDEEKNVTVEYHLLAGQYALLPDLLDSLIRRRVAVIATQAAPPLRSRPKLQPQRSRLYSEWVTIRLHSASLRTSRSPAAT
jgi:putative tryptophan/tyrosine transport system substrate-binding protein